MLNRHGALESTNTTLEEQRYKRMRRWGFHAAEEWCAGTHQRGAKILVLHKNGALESTSVALGP